jgi:hypothetical protein
MVRIALLLFSLAVLGACNREPICRVCGYYTGTSQKVDLIPGTNIGSYSTNTVTHEVWRNGQRYTTAGFSYTLDKDGLFVDEPDEAGQLEKGYISLSVRLQNDSLFFDIKKPGGLSENFEGRKVN